MKRPRWRLRYAAIAVAGCTVAATAPFGATLAQAGAPGPSVHLVAAQNTITVPRFGHDVFLDPGIYVESLGSALQFNVQRASYAKPVTIRQVIHLPGGGTEFRSLPASLLDGLSGLRNFVRLKVRNSKGKVVAAERLTFCPDVFDPQRATHRPAAAGWRSHGNTGVNGGSPDSTARTLASAMAAIWRRVSSVALPKCGSSTVRGAARSRGWMCGSSR